ncbi:MAG: hypothetical protein E2598_07500 [Sphingobium sp.]|nr:hypothetical protein [Sphingobium sp.]
MMILTNTHPTAAIRYTPEWLKGDDAPVFLLRAGTVFEREMMEASLTAAQAGTVWPWELYEAISSGFTQFGGEFVERLLMLAEAAQSGDLEDEADLRDYKQALKILGQHWPAYKDLMKQQANRNVLLPLESFRRFCVGWENITHDGAHLIFAKAMDQCVTEALLAKLDPLLLRGAGLRAYNLQYGGGEEKNSVAPSKSDADPVTLNMGAKSPAGGSSEKTATKKTRR